MASSQDHSGFQSFAPGSGGSGRSLPRDRSFMKPQGRDYNKPRTYNTSPTSLSNRGGVVRVRPGRELYRPPTGEGEQEVYDGGRRSSNSFLNPTAQEFAPLSPAPLTSSRSMDWGTGPEERVQHDNIQLSSHRPPPLRTNSLRKSHSLASSSLATATEISRVDVSGLGTFPAEVEATIRRALEDPNRVGPRALMELVRTVFQRVVEGRGMAEPAARLCISIIEREVKETFLESLLNTCQEWYHERGALLRASTCPPGRWPAFMAFLNEMYGLLKRRQLQLLTKYEGIPPKLVLLSLLSECCVVTLTGGLTLATPSEVEVLFLVLTHIGRDLQMETPGQMCMLLQSLRDSFLHTTAGPSKEDVAAAGGAASGQLAQLPAQAVMYYYPGAAS